MSEWVKNTKTTSGCPAHLIGVEIEVRRNNGKIDQGLADSVDMDYWNRSPAYDGDCQIAEYRVVRKNVAAPVQEYRKFGDLSREEKLALMTAWVDGEKIELQKDNGEWVMPCVAPFWHDDSTYRIAPKPVVKPSINWDHVAEKYVALAVDESGSGFLYTAAPEAHSSVFMGEYYSRADGFPSFNPGSFVPNKDGVVENWQDSLVFRPGYEPKGEAK